MSTEFVDNRATDLKDEGNLLHASNTADPIQPIIDFLEPNLGEEENKYMIPEKTLLNHGHAFDIVRPSSRRSCCFTKGLNECFWLRFRVIYFGFHYRILSLCRGDRLNSAIK